MPLKSFRFCYARQGSGIRVRRVRARGLQRPVGRVSSRGAIANFCNHALAVLLCTGRLACGGETTAFPNQDPHGKADARSESSLFSKTNLFAWCIVPFDAKKRGPEERAVMLERLGFRSFAYDYRAEHVTSFDLEMEALKRHHVHLIAWWFPTALNDEARLILRVLERHGLKVQLWVTGSGEPAKGIEEQRGRVESEARRIRPIAEAAAKIGCTVALYNHGGWFGEPANQIQIIKLLNQQAITNLGIVYNLHHGHGHVDDFAEVLRSMKPWLVALNLNGMTRDGDRVGEHILPLGQGSWTSHCSASFVTAAGRDPSAS